MRYRIKGQIEGAFWDAVDEGMRKGAFRSLEGSGELIGMGWASIDDFADTEFRGSSYVRGNYIGMALRIDTVRVPARVLEMTLRQEGKKLMEETGRRRLSNAQRRELKERIVETLKKQVLPSIQVFEVIWDTAQAVVYFASLSVKARERMEDHFKKSFGLPLIPLIPYLRAEELVAGSLRVELLEKLKPSSFIP